MVRIIHPELLGVREVEGEQESKAARSSNSRKLTNRIMNTKVLGTGIIPM